MTNSIAAIREVLNRSDANLCLTQRELAATTARAERAEVAVETARAKVAQGLEAACSSWATDLEEVRGQAMVEAERAQIISEELETTRAMTGALDLQIGSLTLEVKAAEMRVASAEETTRAAEAKAAAREAAASAAEARAMAAEKRAQATETRVAAAKERVQVAETRAATVEEREQAAEVRAATTEEMAQAAEVRASRAIEEFRSSKAFEVELADTSTDAFLMGFANGRDKVSRIFSLSCLEGIKANGAHERPAAGEELTGTEAASAEDKGAPIEAKANEVTPTEAAPTNAEPTEGGLADDRLTSTEAQA